MKNHEFRRIALLKVLCVLYVLGACKDHKKTREPEHPERPNVFVIAVDDLNDWIGVLGGHPQAKTPIWTGWTEVAFSNFIYNFGPFSAEEYLTGFQGQLGGLNIPTPSIIDEYETGDKRKDASIGYYADPVNSNAFESFPGDSIPYTKKYHHPPFEIVDRTNDNWPVYRYAGVLLMLAEALNEEGKAGEAYGYLNDVRERAGLEELSGLSAGAFRDAVYHEQRMELAFENKRWYELLRTDRAIEVMTAHLRTLAIVRHGLEKLLPKIKKLPK